MAYAAYVAYVTARVTGPLLVGISNSCLCYEEAGYVLMSIASMTFWPKALTLLVGISHASLSLVFT